MSTLAPTITKVAKLRKKNEKNTWVDLEYNKEHGVAARKKGGEWRCFAIDLDLRWRTELQRFKNEEGKREEGGKGHARMIPREEERVGMRGGEGRGLHHEGGRQAGWELLVDAPRPARCPNI
jgi:hypothetical protein